MKVYRGFSDGGDTSTGHMVVIEEYKPDQTASGLRFSNDVVPLEHHVRHSPGGFSWGYGGSGPADLARSIMWDFLGEEPHPACYQAFKFAHVAGWAQHGSWAITEPEVRAWLAEYRQTGKPETVSETEA